MNDNDGRQKQPVLENRSTLRQQITSLELDSKGQQKQLAKNTSAVLMEGAQLNTAWQITRQKIEGVYGRFERSSRSMRFPSTSGGRPTAKSATCR